MEIVEQMSKKNEHKGSQTIKYILFSIIIVIVIAGIGFFAYKILVENKPKDDNQKINPNKQTIEGYGISVDDLDSDLYREEYEILKKNLLSDSINYEDYAKSVAKMFIIDLYTIKNKINKYDVGGCEFVLPNFVENYKINVTDTIYKYVADNSLNDRTQNLPVVNEISIESMEKKTYDIKDDKSYEAYKFSIVWGYSTDLGYETKGEVIVILKDDKMYIVEKN